MAQQLILPAIMSGGAGTRLWPASTDARPKQFHALAGADSLFTQTARRVSGQTEALRFAPPLVLANAAHLDLARAHLAQAGVRAGAYVLEPHPRNTAPLGVIAAALAAEMAPDALVLLMPADHVVADPRAFLDAIARAAPTAKDRIVAFGVAPDRPETGYGYIKRGEEIAEGVFAVARFQEKPDAETAARYLREGGYDWNAGLFLFDPRVIREEFAARPELRDAALQALARAQRREDVILLDADAFARLESIPIDVAIMEKTARGAVAPCAMGWADVGAWSEIWRLGEKDAAGNVVHGQAVLREVENTLVRADGVAVCVAGVRDLIVVATPEGVLVLPRARAQEVKDLCAALLKGETEPPG